jgi:hypothetical protein
MINSPNDDDLYPSGLYDVEMEARRRRNRFLLSSGLIVGAFLAICIFFYSIVSKENRRAALGKFVPFLATSTPTATPTPTALFDDPSRNYFATATAYPLASGGAGFQDDFARSKDIWCEGEEDDNWSTNNFQIAAGLYTWTVTAKRGMFLRCTLDEDIVLPDEFYLAAEMSATGAENAQAALVFRDDNLGSHYVFDLYPAYQAFVVYLYHDEEWIELIPYTYSDLVDSTGPNRLAVLADGTRYVYFVNGEMIGSVVDDTLSGGSAGLGISLDEGESAEFVFDNFEVKYP